MPYKRSDWKTALARLASARKLYERYKDSERESQDPDELDEPVMKTWTFGEYAINVLLECLGEPPDHKHTQDQRARVLFQDGSLARDYSDTLEKLNRYRKKASHLGYARERSTHYSAADVLRAIVEMEALRDEVTAALEKSGKL